MELSNLHLGLIVVSVIVVIGLIYYFVFHKKEKYNNIEKLENGKTLKYYGGSYCPHSNENSRTYKLINEEFRNKYPDVNINIYWSSPENREEFENAKAEYVPTITNDKYEHIELKLPENTNVEEFTDEQLKDILLENIYNQLN